MLAEHPLPLTQVNRGAGAWQPRLLLLFEVQLLLCQSASAAHTASFSARLSASKTTGSPSVGVCCALMETVIERLPLGLAAMNLLYSAGCVEGEFSEGRGIKSISKPRMCERRASVKLPYLPEGGAQPKTTLTCLPSRFTINGTV